MIKVDSLSKRYGNTLAVDNISFEIEKGEVVGLLGPNGAGKTTTMKIMTTFMPSNDGKVIIGGNDVSENPLKVKQMIGYLPETCPLYLDMETGQYLRFVAQIRGIEPAKREKSVQKVISECNLGKVVKKQIAHLSKGYRQRVGLAQALIHEPDVLVLDEPTSGLDPNQIREILNLINNLGEEKTVIHSTHILGEVEKTSDRVLIINEGKIVGKGTPAELMAQSAGTTIYITVIGGDILNTLNETAFIKQANKISEAEGAIRYAINCKAETNTAEDVFKLAVDKGWSLKELYTESASLEEVFTRLTKG